ncbi:MAG: Lactate utilization protein [Gemmatimonadetes bacterium]|nr:Lactate utilization protein [Gemmatimonadota bacterium]
MTSRESILAAVRAARPAAVALPDVRTNASSTSNTSDDVREFIVATEVAGARVVTGTRADLGALIDTAYPAGGRQVSAMDLLDANAERLLPHSFADTDVFVCEGVVGVAENGAIWLPLSRLRHRSALFLATNVIVVLDRNRVVRDLHAAYDAIDVAAEGFGVFVSGPSKTADIEQSLVIGAHGAKSLTVLLIE